MFFASILTAQGIPISLIPRVAALQGNSSLPGKAASDSHFRRPFLKKFTMVFVIF